MAARLTKYFGDGSMNMMHAGFIAQASRNGGRLALRSPEHRVTYGELFARAARLARVVDSSIPRENLRPIVINGAKGPSAIEAIVAALLTGRGYMFADPKQRAPRLSSAMEQLRPSLIVDIGSDEWDHNPEAIAHGARVIRLPETLPENPLDPISRPDGCAYTFFTSGSTGRPKGVVVGHAAAWHAQTAFISDVGLNAHDVVCSEMALGYDVSTIDIFATLAVGATFDVTPEETVEDMHSLYRHLTDSGVTHVFTVPTVARMILEIEPNSADRLRHLRLCLTGELIPERLARQMEPMVARGQVWNQYGATEFPFGLSRKLVPDDLATPNLINNPTQGSPVSVRLSDLGDVTLVGVGLFSGYVTPETDFAHLEPVASFMTGDRAEPHASGVLRLLGRSDNQSRMAGYRIELREIECAAERHPDVDLCYATFDADNERLIARVTAKGSIQNALDIDDLRNHLTRQLPIYMVPAVIEQLVAAPRTLSGKKRYTNISEAQIIR